MKQSTIKGVFTEQKKLFTINPEACQHISVYNERLVTRGGQEYRSWNPYRSKLAAALHKELQFSLSPDAQVLYLGAATGTTVSHLSDIVQKGLIYAVEQSPLAMQKLLHVCKQRPNIIPILEDAYHPDRYSAIVSPVHLVYQDISQRNQAEIFLKNIRRYLQPKGTGLIMVKARSIDVSLKPEHCYQQVIDYLKDHGATIITKLDLSPFETDHAALLITME
jgi:fibrillarin-like pre-rRNA processing protein